MQVELELTKKQLKVLGDEWEVVSVSNPKDGEHFLSETGQTVLRSTHNGFVSGPRIIVCRKWKWPEWIKPGTWLAMDQGGQWCLYVDKPTLGMSVWSSEPGEFLILDARYVDWTPPTVSDWKHSLMQKPMEDK